MTENAEYTRMGVVDIDKIPGWVRRPHRWDDLVEDVLNLEPGHAVIYSFSSVNEARRASNSVRDRANRMLAEKKINDRRVSTRILPGDDDEKVNLHLKLERKEAG
jgi:hypothetical protein